MVQNNIIDIATRWVIETTPKKLSENWHSTSRDVFQVRLQSFLNHVQKEIGEDAYLLTAIAGEIGNNSFDHNLGNWRDVPGVFFAHDREKKFVVLADRGQGIRQTITRAMPDITDDQQALKVAFTQVLSGRKPERRGNGLKFVVQVLKDLKWSLIFQSGNAELFIKSGEPIQIKQVIRQTHGCLAILYY